MAGPVSTYADEIQQAIHEAMMNQADPKGRSPYELPSNALPSEAAMLTKNPDLVVPMDVAHMVLGMQRARGRTP
jgi:hypothetical protein